jgi:hypothetical protein
MGESESISSKQSMIFPLVCRRNSSPPVGLALLAA